MRNRRNVPRVHLQQAKAGHAPQRAVEGGRIAAASSQVELRNQVVGEVPWSLPAARHRSMHRVLGLRAEHVRPQQLLDRVQDGGFRLRVRGPQNPGRFAQHDG